jgi:hypothetical protein
MPLAVGLVAGSLVAGAVRAEAAAPLDAPPAHELTLEAEAVAFGASYAWRVAPRTLLGFGGSIGLSPLLGTIWASNGHYDRSPGVALVEVAAVQGFTRLEAAPWLRIDLGLRFGGFVHGSENFKGGPFLLAFAAPAVGYDWFWIGPRIGVGGLSEMGENPSFALELDALIARLSFTWW